MHTSTMEFLDNITSLTRQYDLFILDLWGVIHDGQNLYPGVRDCLEHLRKHKKKIIFLSNAPRRADTVATALLRMGVTDALYDKIVTSGEVFYQSLAHPEKSIFRPGGRNYIYMGLERDRNILEGSHYQEVKHPDVASFLLLSHSYHDHQPMKELVPLLQGCIKNRLPALCINPDKEIVRLSGEHVYCAGFLAEEYRLMGGEVFYFGKPHSAVYVACLENYQEIDKKRIVAVGDSLANDIAGANDAGITSVLVTGGILQNAVGTPASVDYKDKLIKILNDAPAKPDFIIPDFRCV